MAKEASPDPGVMYGGMSNCTNMVTAAVMLAVISGNSNLTLANTAHQSRHANMRQGAPSDTRQVTAQVTLAWNSHNRCSGRYWDRIWCTVWIRVALLLGAGMGHSSSILATITSLRGSYSYTSPGLA